MLQLPLAGIDPGMKDLVYFTSIVTKEQLNGIVWSKYLERHIFQPNSHPKKISKRKRNK